MILGKRNKILLVAILSFLVLLLFASRESQALPIADFSGTPTNGTNPLTVQFTDLSISSTGTITSWLWDFGDGGTSIEQGPSHIYNSAGSFTVTLTATDSEGSDTETKTGYIQVSEPPPVADFSGSPTSGIKPLTVQFNDASTGIITSWSWDFGDTGTSTDRNPSHIYAVAGTYTVTLTVTGPGGSDSEIKAGYIIVNEPPPVADFSGTPTSGIKPLTVQLNDASTGVITSWLWDFGDTGTSTDRNPSHIYAVAGTYTVTLTVTGPGGSNSMQKVNYIRATDIIVDHGPENGNVDYPQVAADGNGHVYVVWEDTRNGSSDIYFNYSSDYGFTWQPADIRLDTDGPGTSHSNSPQIARDDSGHVYVVWEDERSGSSDIYFNYSSNHGATWQSSDRKLSNADYAPPPQYPKIACDNAGNVYAAWDDNYFNASSNYGVDWHGAIRFSTSGGTDTQLTCDQNGNVYVAWRSSGILFNYSSTHGSTWPNSDKQISNTLAVPYGLSLASDENGNVYFAWHDGRHDPINPDVYFNFCSDYGSTCGPSDSDIMLNTGTPPTYSTWPDVACDNNGHVYVTWYDRRNGSGDIFLNFSSDYGISWQTSDIRLDTDNPGAVDSGYPEIGSDNNGNVYVIWTDDQAAGSGLYANYSLNHGVDWLSSNRMISSGGFNPQMFTDGSRFYIVRDDNDDIVFNEIAALGVPPFPPANPSPGDGADQVSLMPTLGWRGGDANLDDTLTYDIYFGTSLPLPPEPVSSQTETAYTIMTALNYLTTYYWQVVARDNSGAQTSGPIWSFTTMSGPPRFISFDPSDGETGVGRTDNLIWTATDDDPGDTLTYDVYFGTTNPPVKQYSHYTCSASPCDYEPGLLNHYTVYYWKIVARDNHGTETVGPILSFTTINNPPQFSTYSPANGAINVDLYPTLKWYASDPDGGDTVRYDLYFGTSSPPPLVFSNQTKTNYYPGYLSPLTVYYWKIVARDNHGTETSLDLSFTTLDHLPQFLKYSPNHTAIVSATPTFTLTWSAADLDAGDTLTYDIYFGTSSPPPLVSSNQTGTSYQIGELSPFTRYYWQIIARDNHGIETIGPNPNVAIVWFDASSRPPELSNFLPDDGSIGVVPTIALNWNASDPDLGDTITYDVYFGTSSSPPLVAANKMANTYQPGTLYPLVVYYWKIVARDNHGDVTVGPLLSFTTGNRPPQFLSFSPPDLSTGILVTTTLKWSASDPDPNDRINYDVYFGTVSPPPLVVNKTTPNYSPGTLSPFTVYYWRIVARDNHGTETVGPALMFNTGPPPPNIVSVYPNPCQTEMVISLVGEHFGDTQGNSQLRLGKKVFNQGSVNIIMWSDTRIEFLVPPFKAWPSGTTRTKKLWVTANGMNSNKVILTITRP